MAQIKNVVSIHPYFRPHEGKLDEFLALLPQFVERTSTEAACLFYDFSMSDELIHCREAYIGAAGVAAHLENVGDLLEKAAEVSELEQLEIHGPAEELDKLREGLEALAPAWFVHQCGLKKVGA
ncbi:MAG: quinol monooxygenase YgiN [Verrucomicrobiales bacterium]|jgi:quinol monooxygenase YgiN